MSRLKSRLAKLETNAATAGLSTSAATMVVSCYGRLHGLFNPMRHHRQAWSAVRQMQADYQSGRIGIKARAEGQRDWVGGHDARRELVAAGLAVAVKGSAETTGLQLTPLGRSRAFAMVAAVIPTVAGAEAFTKALRDCPADRSQGGCEWICETTLLPIESNDSGDWQILTDAALEPMVDGAIEATADTLGRVYYRHVADWSPLPESADQDSQELSQVYVDAFVAEVRRLKTLGDTTGGLVIPLSASR